MFDEVYILITMHCYMCIYTYPLPSLLLQECTWLRATTIPTVLEAWAGRPLWWQWSLRPGRKPQTTGEEGNRPADESGLLTLNCDITASAVK